MTTPLPLISELDRFGMTDQPTECPWCGRRTDWEDLPDGSQHHTCPRCDKHFIVTNDEDDAAWIRHGEEHDEDHIDPDCTYCDSTPRMLDGILIACPSWDTQPDGTTHTVIGCGSNRVTGPDHEGLYDCHDCGMFFTAEAVRHEREQNHSKLPICTCGVRLVRRRYPDRLAASLGVWFDHPPIPGRPGNDMVGHEVSAVIPHPPRP